MYRLKKGIDQVLNRCFGNYRGLSPKNPRSFVIPSFKDVGVGLDSIVAEVARKVQKRHRAQLRWPLIVADPITWEVAGRRVHKELSDMKYKATSFVVKSNSIDEVNQLMQHCVSMFPNLSVPCDKPNANQYDKIFGHVNCGLKKYNVIYGVGGGSVIDVAQYAAYKLNLPFVSIPTSLANDGFGSQFSVLHLGQYGTQTLTANVPFGVIVDIALINPKSAGCDRRTRSGIGDLLSNITAGLDWQLSKKVSGQDMDYYIRDLATSAAESVLYHLLETDDPFNSTEFLTHLATGLLQSAEAMGMHGSSRPASGFEHKFCHAMNDLGYGNATHGELVAIGTLISSFGHGSRYSLLRKAFNKVGLPTSEDHLSAFGLSKNQIAEGIQNAVKIKPDRFTILEARGSKYLISCMEEVY